MADYYLFIDTEASGLPKNWSLPYSSEDNWPHAVQVSWLVYDRNRELIKQADHYINNGDFTITPSAIDVHGITPEFLSENGVDRQLVLDELMADLEKYRPLVIGHFIKLDYYVMGAEFYRQARPNPLEQANVFCTMVASAQLRSNTTMRQLHLAELYSVLFNKELQNQHNALVDARATAECFFELMGRNEVTEKDIARQNELSAKWRDPEILKPVGCMPVLLILLVSSLIIYLVWL